MATQDHAHEDHGHGASTSDGDGLRVVSVSERNPKVRTVAVDRKPLGGERTFLPALVRGLAVTARHFFQNVLTRKEVQTVEYPDVKPPYPDRYRGLHRLMHRDDGSVRCVACMMCPTICPARCISIVPGEREDSNEKFPVVFEIDELRCVVCGLCVEVCPCDAIRMDTGIHMTPVEFRGDAVLGKIDLMKRGVQSTAVQGGRGADWREKEPPERGPTSKTPAAPR
jgi:NADH-quinone oxidoreductase subunit I